MEPNGCCKDPVVYQRINEEIKDWVWKTAPGVRDSHGCPKKRGKMIYGCLNNANSTPRRC